MRSSIVLRVQIVDVMSKIDGSDHDRAFSKNFVGTTAESHRIAPEFPDGVGFSYKIRADAAALRGLPIGISIEIRGPRNLARVSSPSQVTVSEGTPRFSNAYPSTMASLFAFFPKFDATFLPEALRESTANY